MKVLQNSTRAWLWRFHKPGSWALIPAWIMLAVTYGWGLVWAFALSLSNSTLMPRGHYIGARNYVHLWSVPRWLVSIENMFLFGVLYMAGSLLLGIFLAILMDQKIRAEAFFRVVFLYPYALSFVVTGLVWQWLFEPGLGIEHTVRIWGWSNFTFDWTTRPSLAIFAIILAGVWQASGLVMILVLAGLRGIDREIWDAARIEGIPTWRVYASIVLPMLVPSLATAVMLLLMGVLRVYDLVVAMTNGGPGIASEVPTKFIMDELFVRHNVGQASAACVIVSLMALAILLPVIRRSLQADAQR